MRNQCRNGKCFRQLWPARQGMPVGEFSWRRCRILRAVEYQLENWGQRASLADLSQKLIARETLHQTLSSLSACAAQLCRVGASGLTGTSDKRAMNLTAAMGIQSGDWSQCWRRGCSQRSEQTMNSGQVALVSHGMRELRQAAREMSA